MFLYILMVTALVAAATGSSVSGSGSVSGSDSTRRPGAKGAEVVEQTMKVIRTACAVKFDDDKLFMRRLAYVESDDGTNPNTYRTGYHGGIWQVDEAMFNKIKEPQNIQALSQYTNKFLAALNIDWATITWLDCRKPLVSALAARLYLQFSNQSIPRGIPQQGRYRDMYYKTGSNANTFINKVSNLDKGCKVNAVDLVFILDTSGSVGRTNFDKMKDFVKNVIKAFNIGVDATRVGVFSYSTIVRDKFFLNSYQTESQVLDAVDKDIVYRGGGTNSHLALDYLLQTMFTLNEGARPPTAGAPRVGIFLTDGQSNLPRNTIVSAKNVLDADITMFSIGVGTNLNEAELKAIASDPDCLHFFKLDNFNEVDSLAGAIEKGACEAPVIADPISDIVMIDSKVSDNQNFKITLYNVTKIQINVTIGWVTLYISYTTYPSEAFYDVKDEATPNHPAVIHLQKLTITGQLVYCNIKNNAGNNTASVVQVGVIPDEKSHCKGVDCKNGGICVDDLQNNNYRCYCAQGYKGTHCEQVDTAGTYDCVHNSPCIQANRDKGKYYFPSANPAKFIQCDQYGGCFNMNCPPGLKFNPDVNVCTL